MLISTAVLLEKAQSNKYAIGAFNVYDLQGVKAVIQAAQELESPVIVQVLPKALEMGGKPLIALCVEAGRVAPIPVSVHLDHCSSAETIRWALEAGVSSVMADGSHLEYAENVAFTRQMTEYTHQKGCTIEAELGRLTGTEDGLTVSEYNAQMTSPVQVVDFVDRTGIDALAVCIGNIHGTYPGKPNLDFDRLSLIRQQVSIPLAMHGTSGLPDEMITRSIELGICKFNVNTEVRNAYMQSARLYLDKTLKPELTEFMAAVVQAMKLQVKSKIELFGSTGMAASFL